MKLFNLFCFGNCKPLGTHRDNCDGSEVDGESSWEYEGEKNSSGLPHGIGTKRWSKGPLTGQEFKGRWTKGQLNGQGSSTDARGNIYEGAFVKSMKEGTGKITWIKNSTSFQGKFVGDEPNGFGTYCDELGRKFEEHWERGVSKRRVRRLTVQEVDIGPEDVINACRVGDLTEVKEIIFSNKDTIHFRSHPLMQTPLHATTEAGHIHIARLLLEYGADASAKDSEGNTPLHIAYRSHFPEMCQFLIENGADTTIKNIARQTPVELDDKIPQCTFGCPKCGYTFSVESTAEHYAEGTGAPLCPNDQTPLQPFADTKGKEVSPIIAAHYQ